MVILATAGCAGSRQRLIVAAGTTLVDSGIIDRVLDTYQEVNPDVDIAVVGNPTRLILELGRQRTAALLITHAPAQETEFIDSGAATAHAPVMLSRFVVVGPGALRAVSGGREAPEVFRQMADAGQTFVSRGDGSGTHDLELSIWLEAGIDPTSRPWYLETGQGMGETLLIADQREAVTLAEYGAFLSAEPSLSLVDLGLDPGGLENPYTGIAVAGSPGAAVAVELLEWLISPAGTEAILDANLELFGDVVYEPQGAIG